ncbi:MAG: hypothetical protein JNJ54_06530 [Myxococcaceae bacterium]|nr:hypothetical protein [Myxococcaceae bacterium]
MSSWKRKRHPDDVPTPVAVALADFCRRAKAPASPALVREALALISDAQDAQVRSLTDEAPAATPLGPFAVIDLVQGATVATATERQASGYYDMARLAAEDADEASAPVDRQASVKPAPIPRASAPRPAKEKKARKPRQTVSDRIAPRKRTPGSESRPRPQQPLPGTAFLPRRHLPAPRGRFTRVDPSRSTFEALLKPESREALTVLVEQCPTRFHVFRTLETGYSGRAGAPLSIADVEGALTRHQLLGAMQKKEREKVLTALTSAKGSAPLAAKELGIRPAEIDGLVGELRLKREAGEIKERFVREALDPDNLALRLSLLGRPRYLADLKIEKRFTDALTRDVTKLLDGNADAATTVNELIELTAKKHALVPDLLNRAVDRLGLTRRYLR